MSQEYQVLKIDQLTRVSDRGGVENYYRVQIKTRGGTVLTVNVDEKDYTPEKIAAILKERATQSDKILAL